MDTGIRPTPSSSTNVESKRRTHRLTLTLAYLTALILAGGLYVLSSGVYTLTYVLIGPEIILGDLPGALADLLLIPLCLFLLLPLLSGIWRLPLLGWVLISIVTVLIPVFPHTLPYYACCSAAHGKNLLPRS